MCTTCNEPLKHEDTYNKLNEQYLCHNINLLRLDVLKFLHVSDSVCLCLYSFLSADSPLLWIRIDPDMSILRKVEFEQADFMWQYQLRYERDVVAQVG